MYDLLNNKNNTKMYKEKVHHLPTLHSLTFTQSQQMGLNASVSLLISIFTSIYTHS